MIDGETDAIRKSGKLEVDGWKIEKKSYANWVLSHHHPELEDPTVQWNKGWVQVNKNLLGQYLCPGCPIDDLETPPAAIQMQIKLQKLAEPPKPTMKSSPFPSSFYLSVSANSRQQNQDWYNLVTKDDK